MLNLLVVRNYQLGCASASIRMWMQSISHAPSPTCIHTHTCTHIILLSSNSLAPALEPLYSWQNVPLNPTTHSHEPRMQVPPFWQDRLHTVVTQWTCSSEMNTSDLTLLRRKLQNNEKRNNTMWPNNLVSATHTHPQHTSSVKRNLQNTQLKLYCFNAFRQQSTIAWSKQLQVRKRTAI